MKFRWFVLLLWSSPLLLACRSSGFGGADYRTIESSTGQSVEIADMVRDLSTADVVFLGEEHGNDVGHRLQRAVLEGLIALRPVVILTLEQFEADVQGQLDLFMAGAITEEQFMKTARPWPNYLRSYAPTIALAKEHGVQVIAANIPRPVASRIAYEGLAVVEEEFLAPRIIWTDEPQYGALFAKAMGRDVMDPTDEGLQRWFTAQCAKDEKMAESISRSLVRAWAAGQRPLVVHLNGKFHSNNGLGTVSRLLRRHPMLDVRIVGMNSDKNRDRKLTEEELRVGDYMWLVKPQPGK